MAVTLPPGGHTPATGIAVPTAWGLAVNDNFEGIVRPPRCRVTRATFHPIVTGIITAIPWTSAPTDAGHASAHWTIASPTVVTVRLTGHYLVGFTARWPANATGARLVYVERNGATTTTVHETSAASAAWLIGSSVERGLDLVAGDTLILKAFHSAGLTLNLGTDAPLSMYIRWMGLS